MRNRGALLRRGPGRSGNISALVALSLVAILGVVGIVVDGGRVMAERRHSQNAADAAAMAAAIDLYRGKTAADARQTALLYAARNGYNNDGTTNTVTVNIPPITGPNAGNASFVEVNATRVVTTFFINFVRPGSAQPRSRGVAGWKKTVPGNGAIVALNLKKKKSFRVKKGDLVVQDGPVYVNSSNSKEAAVAEGGATVTAESIKVTGGFVEKSGGDFTPDPSTGFAPTSDPFGLVSPPSKSGLATFDKVDHHKKESIVLQPGVYSGGIKIKGDGNVVMQPGIYYIDGGGVEIDTKGDLTAAGVMIYNSGSKSGDSKFGSMKLKVDGNFTLTPPLDGDFQGMTLFQDRDNTNKVKLDLKKTGDLISGTLYAANAQVEIKGKGSLDGSQIVSNRFKMDGDGTVTMSYDAATTAKIVEISLVE